MVTWCEKWHFTFRSTLLLLFWITCKKVFADILESCWIFTVTQPGAENGPLLASKSTTPSLVFNVNLHQVLVIISIRRMDFPNKTLSGHTVCHTPLLDLASLESLPTANKHNCQFKKGARGGASYRLPHIPGCLSLSSLFLKTVATDRRMAFQVRNGSIWANYKAYSQVTPKIQSLWSIWNYGTSSVFPRRYFHRS